jgi:hypothetical protein
MVFSCRFCDVKVFWNSRLLNLVRAKPTLCNAKGVEDLDNAQICSVQRHLNRPEEEKEAILNVITSVKPETAATMLSCAEDGISVIFKVQKIAGGGNV